MPTSTIWLVSYLLSQVLKVTIWLVSDWVWCWKSLSGLYLTEFDAESHHLACILLMNHSENITVEGGEVCWQNLGAPPPMIGRIWVPPYICFFLITPIYVFYGLICAIAVLLINSIWKNMGTPLRRLTKSRHPHLTNCEIWVLPSKASPH